MLPITEEDIHQKCSGGQRRAEWTERRKTLVRMRYQEGATRLALVSH
jgi:hypothetical protein